VDAEARLNAFYRLSAAQGLSIHPTSVLRTDYTHTAGRQVFLDYLRQRHPQAQRPTAWLAANDEVAAGVLQAAHEQDLRVPDDFSLIGCDDLAIARATAPPLTTVHLPLYELGRQAALTAALLPSDSRLANEERVVKLLPSLVQRRSVRRLGTRERRRPSWSA
jgi:LacI family transcriptional regulator